MSFMSRRLRETREPEPAPRRQGRGDLAHPRHRAREGEHQDELDPLAETAEADRRGENRQDLWIIKDRIK